MKTEHGYSFSNLAIILFTAIGLVAFLEITEEDIHWLIYAFALAPTLLGGVFMLTKVKVNEEEIRVDYAAPFRAPRVFEHEKISSYSAIKGIDGKGKPSFGFLQVRGEKNSIMLSGLGTKNFAELSAFLESIYPLTTEGQNQAGDGL